MAPILVYQGGYVDRPDGLSLGNSCFLNYGVHCHCGGDKTVGISIGDNDFIDPDVRICCSTQEISSNKRRAGKKPLWTSIYIRRMLDRIMLCNSTKCNSRRRLRFCSRECCYTINGA